MKAAKLYGIDDIRICDCTVPEIADDEILLAVKACAVCGTDVRMISSQQASYPRILGHEISGVISKVGRNVKKYSEGMRVFIAPNVGCGNCGLCVGGNEHLCKNYRAFGVNMDGGFAEYMVISAEAVRGGNIMVLADGVSFEEAAVFEPAACVLNGQWRCSIKKGETVLIIGAGPIGVLHTLMAQAAGARVLVRDLSEKRMKKATVICKGAEMVIGKNLQSTVLDLTNGNGVDVCITACPVPSIQQDVFNLMKINGRVLFFGGLPAGREIVPLNTNIIHYKQLSVFGSTRCSKEHCSKIAEMVRLGELNLTGIITERFALEELAKAVRQMKRAEGLKKVIVF